jgi:hypothetical protein
MKLVTIGSCVVPKEEAFKLPEKAEIISIEDYARRDPKTDELTWFWRVTYITESKI